MGAFKFVPNKAGFDEFRNEPFIQKECLEVARGIANETQSQCGVLVQSDVQTGKTRCHARASAQVSRQVVGSKRWFKRGGYTTEVSNAMRASCKAHGGKATPYAKRHKWKVKR